MKTTTQRIWRLSKWVSAGTTLTSLASIAISPDRDPLYLAYAGMRSWRTFTTGCQIALDYHHTLANKASILPPEEYEALKSQVHLRSAQKMLDAMKKNGGVFVKFGQHLSSLSYLIPMEYVDTFKVLQDRCIPSSLASIHTMFMEDLGVPFESVFASIDPTPIGVASLAQVHHATLKDGTEVALKIQHPNIRKYSHLDIVLTAAFVDLVKYVFPDFEFDWLSEEMAYNLPLELDFQHEAQNTANVTKNFSYSFLAVKIPKVIFAHKRILCMEYVDGKRIDDLEYMKKYKIEPTRVAVELTRIFSKMIFDDGFVHADPHPGNLMILAKPTRMPWLSWLLRPKNFQVVLLDHGLYRELDVLFKENYAQLWKSLIRGDETQIRACSKALAGVDMYGLFACMLTGRSWDTIISGQVKSSLTVNEFHQVSVHAQSLFFEINQVLKQVPRPLLLIFKTNDLIRFVYRGLGLSEWGSLTVMSEYVLRLCHKSTPVFPVFTRWLREWFEIIVIKFSVFFFEHKWIS